MLNTILSIINNTFAVVFTCQKEITLQEHAHIYADFADIIEIRQKTVCYRYMYILHPVIPDDNEEDDVVDQIKEVIDEKIFKLQ